MLVGFGFVCIIIQSNLFLCHHVLPIKPDLTIPLAVYISLSQPPIPAALLVMGIGYLMDATSSGSLGFYIFLRASVFFLIYLCKGRLFFENTLLVFVAVIVLFLIEALLIQSLFAFIGMNIGTVPQALTTALYQGVFTVMLWAVLFPLYKKLDQTVQKVRGF